MKYLKVVCLITCVWWCWFKATNISACYSFAYDLSYCIDRS